MYLTIWFGIHPNFEMQWPVSTSMFSRIHFLTVYLHMDVGSELLIQTGYIHWTISDIQLN